MELADATDSKSVGSDTVRVQVPLPPSTKKLFLLKLHARMVELVDAVDSKSTTERCAGSSPALGIPLMV